MNKTKNQAFLKLLKKFPLYGRYFSANYMRSIKKGADIAEKEILASLKDRDQPIESMARKLYEAIKIGVLHATEQMLLHGIGWVERMKDKSK
ncbi:hypothetical protein D8M04_18865 [Oceanobacillus piezotolerans]|uniref:Uncharacterized protein n=1 Tax=Oceanobacillus piezotolerans TaxID=2448030 RepID=A0A498D974_9BACI|nr:hypothetical protein [Oceanobacillus piezotolerans]RLL40608.1 hypothetical protein D8M04_18865 [Oceanobacillus piezotolerans]